MIWSMDLSTLLLVLQNVAFLSFLGFTTLQLVFAMVAHSDSMMTDCAAMYVDVLSYLVNFLAERLKHGHTSKSVRQIRLHRLYLELIPPLISVVTLVAVTVFSLKQACEILLNMDQRHQIPPDLSLMLLFSAMNLVLDFVNVTCFARVDQAVGIPGQLGEENVHVHIDKGHNNNDEATEETQLIAPPSDAESETSDEEHQGINLNMCSGASVRDVPLRFVGWLRCTTTLSHPVFVLLPMKFECVALCELLSPLLLNVIS